MNCPKCSNVYTEGAKFCKNCGYNLTNESVEKPTCPTCHKTFPVGAKFCDVHGTQLKLPNTTVRKCVVCGTTYGNEVTFCPKDGGSITSVSTPVSTASTSGYNQQQQQHLPPPQYTNNNNHSNRHNSNGYIKASLGNRFVASLLDSLIMIGLAIPAIIFYIAGIAELDSYRGSEESAIVYFLMAILLYLIPLVYSFIKDGIGNGQSWGKKAVGLMVVYLPDNSPCKYGQSAIRGLVSTLVGFIPFVGWLIEPIMVLASDDGRRLADKAANTQVIEIRDYKK
ncbi:RDD family protein [Kordia sp.]|uniref:RDD family protein n=1 Tax=Kordia sp. TaxID=1965332 RepID=UPI003B5B792D